MNFYCKISQIIVKYVRQSRYRGIKMKLDKKYFKSEFILSAILILLIIIMFIVIFMNKDKGELSETSVAESEQNGQNQENMSNNTDEGIEKYKEEKAIEEEKSRMAIGGKVCKKDENVVYVDNDSNKIYMYNLNEKRKNISNKGI